MSIIADKFNLSNFISPPSKSDQRLDSPGIDDLRHKYHLLISEQIKNPKLRHDFDNKIATALFLDKVIKSGREHPDTELVKKLGASSSTFNSTEVIRLLQKIRSDPRLSDETRAAIDTWIQTEKEYLDIAIIFDGWRMQNPHIIKLLESGSVEPPTIQRLGLTMEDLAVNPPKEEVDTLARALATHIKSMKPGETFKMLAGCLNHETRLLIKKQEDSSFTIYHYDTGVRDTLQKFGDVSATKIDTENFWKGFIAIKLGFSLKPLDKLLESLGTKEELDERESLAHKSTQMGETCPGQAVEADLKHQIVLSSKDPQEGVIQYKKTKALLVSAEAEGEEFDPQISSLLKSKAMAKERYLEWAQVVTDPQKFEHLKNRYVELIDLIGRAQASHKVTAALEQGSKVMILRDLDAILLHSLRHAPKAEIQTILKEMKGKEDSPVLCIKQFLRIQRVQDLMKERLALPQDAEEYDNLIELALKETAYDPEAQLGAIDLFLEKTKRQNVDFLVSQLMHPDVLRELFQRNLVSDRVVQQYFYRYIEENGKDASIVQLGGLLLQHPGIKERDIIQTLAIVDPARWVDEIPAKFATLDYELSEKAISAINNVTLLTKLSEKTARLPYNAYFIKSLEQLHLRSTRLDTPKIVDLFSRTLNQVGDDPSLWNQIGNILFGFHRQGMDAVVTALVDKSVHLYPKARDLFSFKLLEQAGYTPREQEVA